MKKLLLIFFLLLSRNCFAVSTTIECMNNLANEKEFKVINAKVLIGDDSIGAPLNILSNNQKPNDAEQKALVKWDKARKTCYAAGNEQRSSYSPRILNVFKAMFNDQDKALGDLYVGKVTYGQYAKTRNDISQKYTEIFAKIRSEEQPKEKSHRIISSSQNSPKENFIDCEKLDNFFDRFKCRGESGKRQDALIKMDTFKAKCDSMGFQRGTNEYSQCMLKMDRQENANTQAEQQRIHEMTNPGNFGPNSHCRSTVNGNQVNTNCY